MKNTHFNHYRIIVIGLHAVASIAGVLVSQVLGIIGLATGIAFSYGALISAGLNLLVILGTLAYYQLVR